MASKVPKGESDIAQLWQAAIQDYEKVTGKSLQLGQFRNMDEVMAGTESLSKNFTEFRRDQSKMAKIRTALKNNMWLIQGIVDTVQTVGNAASVRTSSTSWELYTYLFSRPSRPRCQRV
jgi:hypothetical protein